MIPEISLMKYILIYKNYINYYKYINIDKSFYKELYLIYSIIPKLFEKFPKDANLEELSLFFFAFYPRLKQEERKAYETIFTLAAGSTVSDDTVVHHLASLQQRAAAVKLADSALAYTEGRATSEKVDESIGGWKSPESVASKVQFVTTNLEELNSVISTKVGLRWRLGSLNRALGSLRIGDFGFIFARPETGKTTFLASEVTFFASQTDKPILWFNNEEQGYKVATRCHQAALGVDRVSLFSNIGKHQRLYETKTGDRIKIIDSGVIWRSEVEAIIAGCEPSLIIFDQIDKIYGFEADRNDLVMGSIYQWARNLAKTHAPVIGVCQSDGSGDGIKYLTMNNVADAKTAKQAEADWILGIGQTGNDEQANVRYLHLSKNKLLGDVDSDPAWRHGKWEVIIEPNIARYRDI